MSSHERRRLAGSRVRGDIAARTRDSRHIARPSRPSLRPPCSPDARRTTATCHGCGDRDKRIAPLLSGLYAAAPSVPREERRVAALRTRMLELSAEVRAVRTSTSVPWSALEQHISDGGSDSLIDALIPYGLADEIAAVARRHRLPCGPSVPAERRSMGRAPRGVGSVGRGANDLKGRGPRDRDGAKRQPMVAERDRLIHRPAPLTARRMGGYGRQVAIYQPSCS